ncbi:MAG: hypothetical protein ACREFD_03235 [Stellaceae bacterium]
MHLLALHLLMLWHLALHLLVLRRLALHLLMLRRIALHLLMLRRIALHLLVLHRRLALHRLALHLLVLRHLALYLLALRRSLLRCPVLGRSMLAAAFVFVFALLIGLRQKDGRRSADRNPTRCRQRRGECRRYEHDTERADRQFILPLHGYPFHAMLCVFNCHYITLRDRRAWHPRDGGDAAAEDRAITHSSTGSRRQCKSTYA